MVESVAAVVAVVETEVVTIEVELWVRVAVAMAVVAVTAMVWLAAPVELSEEEALAAVAMEVEAVEAATIEKNYLCTQPALGAPYPQRRIAAMSQSSS